MPYAIEFPVGASGRPPPPKLYHALYANLVKWIGAADHDLSELLHERPVCKPFTISILNQDHDGEWRWRVTLLQDELWDALGASIQDAGVIDLNGCTWPVRWCDVQIARCSYELLLTNVCPTDSIKLWFLSPTVFRREEMNIPLPDPNAVFQSWLTHWNHFAPDQRYISTELLEVVQACVAISAHRVHTRRYDLGSTQVIGFVGQVTYKILNARELNQAQVWQLNALADYAEFCGTGRKTIQGMGQTRRLHRDR